VHPTFCITCCHCFLRVVDDDSTKTNVEPHPKIIHSISTRFIPFHFIHSCWRDATHHPEFLVFLTIRYECLAVPSSMCVCVCVCFFLGGWVGQTFTTWWQKFWDYIILGVIFLIKKLLMIWKFSQKNWGAKKTHKIEKIKNKIPVPKTISAILSLK